MGGSKGRSRGKHIDICQVPIPCEELCGLAVSGSDLPFQATSRRKPMWRTSRLAAIRWQLNTRCLGTRASNKLDKRGKLASSRVFTAHKRTIPLKIASANTTFGGMPCLCKGP